MRDKFVTVSSIKPSVGKSFGSGNFCRRSHFDRGDEAKFLPIDIQIII